MKCYFPRNDMYPVQTNTDWCSELIYFKTRTVPTSCEMSADFTDTVRFQINFSSKSLRVFPSITINIKTWYP